MIFDGYGFMRMGSVREPSRRRQNIRPFSLVVAVLLHLSLIACSSPEERAAEYLSNAQALFESDDLIKAEIDTKNALQIQPKNPQARFLLAQINEKRGEYQEMAANLRVAVEADPGYSEARIKLATLYVLAGSADLAEEQVAALAPETRQTADALVLQARIAAARNELETARGLLEQALAGDPSNVQALGLLASVSAATDLPGALALLDRGIASADDSKSLRVLRIQLLQQAGRTEEVEAEYRALLADYPDETVFGYQLARFLASEGRVDEVEPVMQEIIRNDPGNVEARIALTQFVASTRGSDAAEELLSRYADELPEAYELRLTLARLYQQTGRNDLAYAEYEKVADVAGKEDAGLAAKARMAGIKISAQETEAGEKILEEVLAMDSANVEALTLRGALNIDRKDFRKAVTDLRNVLRSDPDNLRAQLLLARAHTVAGDTVLAEDAYRRALAIDPGNSAATLELARMMVARKKVNDAIELLANHLADFPADAQSSRAITGLLLSAEKPDDAEAEAKRLANVPGQEAVGEYLLGGVYQARDEHERAIEAFRRSLAKAPAAREPLNGLIASFVQLGKTDEAVAFLKNYQKEYPDNLFAQTLLGQVLAGTGDQGAATQVFESTLESDQGWLPAYTALAGLQSGNLSAQIDTYKRGLQALPDSQELVLLLGTAYERSGDVESAIESYTEALAKNPEMQAVANNLAALLADNRTDQASLERALELAGDFADSDNPAFVDTLGWVHFRLGNFDEAVPLLEEAVQGAGQVAVLRYHLGMAYKATGENDKAIEQLKLALADEDAEFAGVDDARAALADLT